MPHATPLTRPLNYDTSEAIHNTKQSHGTESTGSCQRGRGWGRWSVLGLAEASVCFTEWVNYMVYQREP